MHTYWTYIQSSMTIIWKIHSRNDPECVFTASWLLKLFGFTLAVSGHCPSMCALALVLCLRKPTSVGNQLAIACPVVSVRPLPVFTNAVGRMLQHRHSWQVSGERPGRL